VRGRTTNNREVRVIKFDEIELRDIDKGDGHKWERYQVEGNRTEVE
jgi:hypothetical protein